MIQLKPVIPKCMKACRSLNMMIYSNIHSERHQHPGSQDFDVPVICHFPFVRADWRLRSHQWWSKKFLAPSNSEMFSSHWRNNWYCQCYWEKNGPCPERSILSGKILQKYDSWQTSSSRTALEMCLQNFSLQTATDSQEQHLHNAFHWGWSILGCFLVLQHHSWFCLLLKMLFLLV